MPRRSKISAKDREFVCNYCRRTFTSGAGVKSHIRQTPSCQQEFDKHTYQKGQAAQSPSTEAIAAPYNSAFDTAPDFPMDEEPPSKRARIDDVEDEDDELETGGLPKRPFVDYSARLSTKIKGRGQTLFEAMDAAQAGKDNPWAPFADKEEWELAHWLMTKGLTQSAVDDYLKLPIVSISPSHSRVI